MTSEDIKYQLIINRVALCWLVNKGAVHDSFFCALFIPPLEKSARSTELVAQIKIRKPKHDRAHSPSTAFRHLPPNYDRFSYATEGTLFISVQLSTDVVCALQKVWAQTVEATKRPSRHVNRRRHSPWVSKKGPSRFKRFGEPVWPSGQALGW